MDISEVILEAKRILRELDNLTCTPGTNMAQIQRAMDELVRIAGNGYAIATRDLSQRVYHPRRAA